MKVLITGANGQLGQDVQKLLQKNNIEFVAAGSDILNITNIKAIRDFIKDKNIDVIINCAAYNNVDKAESDWKIAYNVNGLAVRNLATVANENDAVLVHYSTDYVFYGNQKEPYTLLDVQAPISKYGESKLLGERFALQTAKKAIVIRTSWVFGAGNSNFVKKVLEWSTAKNEIKVVDDQISSPTYTVDLAKATLDLINQKVYGLYHVTNTGHCSRYEWADYVLKKSGWNGKLIPVKSEEFNTPAQRPQFSALDNMGFEEVVGYEMPHWKDATDRFLSEI